MNRTALRHRVLDSLYLLSQARTVFAPIIVAGASFGEPSSGLSSAPPQREPITAGGSLTAKMRLAVLSL